MRTRRTAIFVAAAAAVLVVAAPGTSQPAADLPELAFVRGGQIWVTGAAAPRAITRGYAPKWSADGRRLVFSRDVRRSAEIFSANGDGTDLRRLTRNSVNDYTPAWSPDGRRIAFVSNRSGRYRLFVMRSDGTGVRAVTPPSRRGDVFSPAWSPDGRLIVFSSSAWTPENPELYVVRPDGTGLRRLTRTKGDAHVLGDDGWPSWSPDGKRIAFTSNRTNNGEVWVMNANGSGQRRLAGFPRRDDWAPSFSPDGRWIAFHSLAVNGTGRLYVVRSNGTSVRTLGIAGTEAAFRP